MSLLYRPLLQIQRDIYNLPPGKDRFQRYLAVMTDSQTGDIALPLTGLNPMGKAHVPLFLDTLLALQADAAGARATEAAQLLFPSKANYQICIVVSDDLGGGWTNRYTTEFSTRFELGAFLKRGWIVATLWTSETYDALSVYQEVLAAIARAHYFAQNGAARTLGEMLAQEAYAMQLAGVTPPTLTDEEQAHTLHILTYCRAASDHPTIVAALFGDAAAEELGYPPLGLPPRAGLAQAHYGLPWDG